MKRAALVMLLLISLYQISLSAAESEIKPIAKKSVIVGMLLGALAFVPFGIPIPGTFGWGNSYAKDYIGFRILNIGGSICSALLWVSFIAVGGPEADFDTAAGKVFWVTTIIGAAGSGGFALASIIWGALSVVSYNRRVERDRVDRTKNKLSFELVPGVKGISMGITYHY